jgi:two-component system NtrC family sensor kinase
MNSETPRVDENHVLRELRERMKELSCLYTVTQIIAETDLSRKERIQKIVMELPRAWRHPDNAVARITLDDEAFESSGYECVGALQRSDLVIEGVRRGAVEVGYTATLPSDGEDRFFPEERSLLVNIARQVALFITREEGTARRTMLEEQLRHADRLATIGQLAAGVAHEMNEPLSNVLGFAQLALKAPGTPQPVVDDLREIVSASLRAREIVKKLLLFARQTPPKKTSTNLNELVEDALFLLEAGCETQGIKIIRRLTADLPTIEADPVQIRQVLVNLTVNAMQAIATEGTVTVETKAEDQLVVLSVTDTGHGMSPEILSKIFSPFFTTKDVGEGTGLGLSVVHGIVTAHGGTIDAESRGGSGSRFIVRLPVPRTRE